VNFLLDHDVPIEAARLLRREGHVASRLIDVFAYAREHGAIMVTCNGKDYLPLTAFGPHAGLIILIRRRSRQAECGHLLRLLRTAGESGIKGNINFA
jgi:hypothetical protein